MSNKVHWNRRQFVVAGTTAVVGLAAWPYEAVATDSPTAPAFVSVGFVNEISGRTRRAARLTPTFMPADSVLTGDPTFFREGARIRVHGFNVAKQSLSLHVLHPVDELPERVPFYAWASGANGVAFRVPVGAQELVEIVVERRDLRNPEAPVERAVLRFGVNSGRDA